MIPSTDTLTIMNNPKSAAPNPSEFVPPGEGATLPISLCVLVVIADARKRTRVFEAGREQSYAATPESLAVLPGHLVGMLRGASVDAQRELNKFLAVLAEPEPPAVAPPSTPSPAPAADYLTPPTLPLLGAELPVAA